MTMRVSEILRRIKSFGIPGIVSLGFDMPEADVSVARRVINELENRRALYQPIEMQDPNACIESIKEIRKMLNDEIGRRTSDDELQMTLKAMRAACRDFLNKVESSPAVSSGERPYWLVDGTLGKLRAYFGIHLGILAVKHNLPLEDDLASILPTGDVET
jgi:hypothetical protein